jgi:sugar lactone lactonase YvrE
MQARKIETLVRGLCFAEGPRWHQGRLWFSDLFDDKVLSWKRGEPAPRTLLEVSGHPSGLGFLPDGSLLAVSFEGRRVVRASLRGSEVLGSATYADLSSHAASETNDMVVSASGIAYIGQLGAPNPAGGHHLPSPILCLGSDGRIQSLSENVRAANGMAITPDGRTLIAAETFGDCLTSFAIDSAGKLGAPRVIARFPEAASPDGICLDAEGAVWVACPGMGCCYRVSSKGEVLEQVRWPEGISPIACALGDDDRRTLYVTSRGPKRTPERYKADRVAAIDAVRVDVPGDGRP